MPNPAQIGTMEARPILFVHGAFHGAWCWEEAIRELAARGRRAIAIDLPGHGADRTPRGNVGLEDYAARIGTTLGRIDVPVTLVAHSMGGIPATIAAERAGERVAALIYLSALVPLDGETLNGISERNPDNRLERALSPAADGASHTMDPAEAQHFFFHDCATDVAARAAASLTPQPLRPLLESADLSAGAVDARPRGYIVMRDDRALSPERQRFFAARCRGIIVTEIDGGHSPFLAQPAAFVDTLCSLETRIAARTS